MMASPHPQARPPYYEDAYMYPPRPYPPSLPPVSKPYPGNFLQAPPPPHFYEGGPGKNQHPPSMIGVLNGFTDENGQIDIQKTMTTVDTAIKTYQQVSPMIKQLSSMFLMRN
ncbi:hypothetical protein HNR44_001141 [Geomicrobium halophilum]|uniref:YppG-like protein n=1 Tax=Geomicrobium halophilum TaxID=549000 RepID=A0A841PY51_9BACL|nr:YppG family protein [Geomicrobium halophilum]MBB6449192.1 hypothetical protein [Geomicrobium halophilum]